MTDGRPSCQQPPRRCSGGDMLVRAWEWRARTVGADGGRRRRAPTAGADASWSRVQPTASTETGSAEPHSARAAKCGARPRGLDQPGAAGPGPQDLGQRGGRPVTRHPRAFPLWSETQRRLSAVSAAPRYLRAIGSESATCKLDRRWPVRTCPAQCNVISTAPGSSGRPP